MDRVEATMLAHLGFQLLAWLLLACPAPSSSTTDGAAPEPEEPTTQTTPTSPTTPVQTSDCDSPDPDPGTTTVAAETDPTNAHLATAALTLGAPADVAVRCVDPTDADEVLFWETSMPAADHTLLLGGLRADTTYECAAVAVCPAHEGPATAFTITTGALPGGTPSSRVTTHRTLTPHAGTPHFLVNHSRFCEGEPTQRLLVYDVAGELRWSYAGLPPHTPIAIGAEYVGGGQFLWGGGWTQQGRVQIVDLDRAEVYKSRFDGWEGRVYHHEGRMLHDGTVLMLTAAVNRANGESWEGFELWRVDPTTDEVVWRWNSQQAVDAGVLPPGTDDVYHANAADIVPTATGDVAVVSLCYSTQILGIDVATGSVRWNFDPQGTFDLVDSDGASLPDTEYPDCQHGIEYDGETLLTYDNGRFFRGYSRAAEYRLDHATGVATQTWTWTEPNWHEGALGDVDWISPARVLVTEAHPDCWSFIRGDLSTSVEVDRASGEVAWRHEFLDPQDTTYRSERFNGCDAFPQAALCPAVAARLDALSEHFEQIELPTIDPWPVHDDAGAPEGAVIYTWDAGIDGGPGAWFEEHSSTCPSPVEGTSAHRMVVGDDWSGNTNWAGWGVFLPSGTVDVSEHDTLVFSVASSAAPDAIKVEIAVDDTKTQLGLDGVVSSVSETAWTEVSLPLGDTAREAVNGLFLITVRGGGETLCVDDVRFE